MIRYILLAALLSASLPSAADGPEWARRTVHRYRYKRDRGADTWTPSCTTGDCEDLALCLLDRLGDEATMISVTLPSGEGHMIVEYKGRYYDTFGVHGPDYEFTKVMTWRPEWVAAQLAR